MSKSLKKRVKYGIAGPILHNYLSGLLRTSKRSTQGYDRVEKLIADRQAIIPCYWHQQNISCAISLLDWRQYGLKAGFLISPSNDGEAPAKEFARRGAAVIRGSSSRTGASAIRDLYRCIKVDGISPANTPDGPRGPIYEYKIGSLMLAQMTGAPIVPMAAACSRYWQFNSWDKFILPKWFSHIVLAIGEPVYVEKNRSMTELEALAKKTGAQLMQLTEQAESHFKKA